MECGGCYLDVGLRNRIPLRLETGSEPAVLPCDGNIIGQNGNRREKPSLDMHKVVFTPLRPEGTTIELTDR